MDMDMDMGTDIDTRPMDLPYLDYVSDNLPCCTLQH
jgi:hypothetical protein